MTKKYLSNKAIIIYYIIINTIITGIDMGVPVFSILLGFPFGAYITKKIIATETDSKVIYQKILKAAWWSAGYTFLMMIIIWLPQISKLFNPNYDIANFGHPLILFEPTASFIGWLVLMIVISPFLQVLTTVFASFLVIKRRYRGNISRV